MALVTAVLTGLWRWRREMWPLWAALGILLVAALGHGLSEALAWLPLLAGAAGMAAVLALGHKPIHRWFAGGAGAAGLWTATAWWAGLADPVVMGGFLAMLVTASAVWFRHVHPRPRVRVIGGSRWPWQWERFRYRQRALTEIRRAMSTWEVASFWGRVPRSSIRAAVADIVEDHWLLIVELIPGHIGIDLDNRRAASAIGAPVAHVAVVQEERGSARPANVVEIQWFHDGLVQVADEDPANGEDEAAPAAARPEPANLQALRMEMLQVAVAHLGAEVVSTRRLARAADLPHDWVNRWIDQLAGDLGLRRVNGGWQRLAVEESA